MKCQNLFLQKIRKTLSNCPLLIWQGTPKDYPQHTFSRRNITLKASRKTASENVVCLCRLLNILADFLKKYFCIKANSVDPDQTAPKDKADNNSFKG